ncbi:hypothetical protein [Brevundimonas nasdae]|uniref:hypothetical protein n=1 Tax=Brevundimonas nasdae TaxID=172043 RepID=UPI002898C223|nr:hypothetical protein [Brevundimonas nasdae]
MKSILPINRPLADASDLNATTFENVDIILYELYSAASAQGVPLVQGRTFRGCRFQGPAIVLVSNGVTFNDTNFGDGRGSIQNLLVRPVGDKAIGTIPMRDCHFIGCEFYGVGFTGTDEFIEQVSALTDKPKA